MGASGCVPGCAMIKSDMYKTQILYQLYDHAKQYDNDGACHNKMETWKLHGNISQNGYGNAIIGRYSRCFEEGYMVG